MNRRAAQVTALALAAGMALGVVACGRDDPHDDATSTNSQVDTRVCAIIEVPRKRMLDGQTFAELVELPSTAPALSGTAAAVFLLRNRQTGDLGPYAPVIDHLARLGKVDAEGHGSVPEAGGDVRTSARRLDRALASGSCD